MIFSRRIQWPIAVVGLLCLLLLCGCGGNSTGPSFPGMIVGTVVDEDGRGIEGAWVYIVDTPLEAYTNAKGNYEIRGVPFGSWKLLAAKPGYRIMATPPTPENPQVDVSTSVRLTYRDSSARAPAIRLIPYDAQGDDVTITKMSIDRQASIPVGSHQTLDLELFYTLNSSLEATISAILHYGSMFVAGQEINVSQGSGTVNIDFPFVMPDAPSLTLQLALIDEHGIMATMSQPVFHVPDYREPRAPVLKLDSVDRDGIKIRWSNEDLPNFKELRIYRSEELEHPIRADNSDLVAIITDPEDTTFVDTDYFPGETLYYLPYFETLDGQAFWGYLNDTLEVSVGDIEWNTLEVGALFHLIYNPVYDHLYALSLTGQMKIIDGSSLSVIRELPIDCQIGTSSERAYGLSEDGSLLAVVCYHSNRIAKIVLPEGEVSYIENLQGPLKLFLDPNSSWLLVTLYDGIKMYESWKIDIERDEREPIPFSVSDGMVLLSSGLLIRRDEYSPYPIVIYDTHTWDVVTEWEDPRHFGIPSSYIHLAADETMLITSTNIFSVPDGRWLGATPPNFSPSLVAGSLIFQAGGRTADIHQLDGQVIRRFARFEHPGFATPIALSNDSTKLFFKGGSKIHVADIGKLLEFLDE